MVYTKQIETGADKVRDGGETLLFHPGFGEVSIENENYSQAMEDIRLCLKKQENLPKDSR